MLVILFEGLLYYLVKKYLYFYDFVCDFDNYLTNYLNLWKHLLIWDG